MTPRAYSIKSKIGVVPQEVSFRRTYCFMRISTFCDYIFKIRQHVRDMQEAIDFVELTIS